MFKVEGLLSMLMSPEQQGLQLLANLELLFFSDLFLFKP